MAEAGWYATNPGPGFAAAMRRLCRDKRLLIVLLVLCATVAAQSAALSAQSRLHQPTDHCCLLCHVGPLAFLETSVSSMLAPVFQVVWLAPPARPAVIPDVLVVPGCSRAPPSV